ncbi:high mobility group protein B1-like [Gorilla gorilla gorilla]|uniref:high mobility group protein B1-like n=1 Tax=Gorilla gorilla gorilla TaxID=9595 RepID=UPI00300A13AD
MELKLEAECGEHYDIFLLIYRFCKKWRMYPEKYEDKSHCSTLSSIETALGKVRVSVNFSEFSKKFSERWKNMSAKEKGKFGQARGKFEDMAKADKSRYKREMKTYIPPKGETKKKFKDPNAPKRPPSAFFLYFSEYGPKVKGERPGLSVGDVAKKLGEMWNNTAADDKQPYEKRSVRLKEKYEKDIAAYRAKGKHDAANNGVVKAAKSKKKKEEEENEEDEEDEEEEKDEEDEDEEDDEDEEEDGDDERAGSSAVFLLSIKHLIPLYTTHSF